MGTDLDSKRMVVFSIRKHDRGGGYVWTRSGTAFSNKDGSLNVVLEVLPLNGRLHIRDVLDPKPMPSAAATAPEQVSSETEGDPTLRAAVAS